MTIMKNFWNPDVLASKSFIPDPTPVMAPLLLNNLSISKKPLSSTLESGSYSLESFFSAISNTFFCAKSITFSTSPPITTTASMPLFFNWAIAFFQKY